MSRFQGAFFGSAAESSALAQCGDFEESLSDTRVEAAAFSSGSLSMGSRYVFNCREIATGEMRSAAASNFSYTDVYQSYLARTQRRSR